MTVPVDDELTALALAADPDQPIHPDARPFVMGDDARGPLPSWYMPAPAARMQEPWQVAIVLFLIGTLTVISGLGLCITYGYLVAA